MFFEKLNLYRKIINDGLENFLSKLNNEDCNFVCSAMRYSLIGGGKLIRPVLTLAVCDMFRGDIKKAVAFACAVEFMHVGSLVHDDLPCMDDDDERRGRASCHVKYDEAVAVLAGDSLFCAAFEILTYGKEYGLKDEDVVKAVFFLSNMFGPKGIVGGQDLDIYSLTKNATLEQVEKTAKYKTCSLIRAACYLGAIAANASDFEIKTIDRYAIFLGLCFQLCDDILDYDEGGSSKDRKDFLSFYSLKKAKDVAEQYTNKALKCLDSLKYNEFLVELTKNLLMREN